jgi:hypothetical protein
MFQISHSFRPLCGGLLLLAASGLSGCAGKARSESAQRAAETSGELSAKESLSTSVESVDVAGRSVTLRDANGRPFTIVTGDSGALERMQPDDAVRLVYQEAVSFQLQDEEVDQKTAPPLTVQRFETKRLPDREGVEFARRVDTVVEIVSVDPEGSTATFRIPEGNVRAVEIEDARNREKVKRLRPGDAVAVVYTEKLLLEPER